MDQEGTLLVQRLSSNISVLLVYIFILFFFCLSEFWHLLELIHYKELAILDQISFFFISFEKKDVDIISIMSARYRSANCKTQRMRRGPEYITVCPPLNM